MAALSRDFPFEHQGMGTALLVAVVAHAILILGIGFRLEATDAPAPTIEVTLARHPSNAPPEESDYIARFDQTGSGSATEKQELTSDRIPPLESTVFRETDLLQPMQAQEKQANPVEQKVVSTRGETENARSDVEEERREGSELTRPRTVREIASLRAKLARQRQLYSRLPRTLVLTAASARRSDHAEYLRQWIEWVERVGNENYPEEARRKRIYGAIRLAVALDRGGSVASVEILQSSGQRVLDQAAIRIVRLAAPFAPIPDSIQEDQVEIIRTWNFIPGDRFHTSPQ